MYNVCSGHAPGNLRDEFLHALASHRPPFTNLEVQRLAGFMWNCTDIAPGEVCDNVGVPRGSTCAQLARAIRAPR